MVTAWAAEGDIDAEAITSNEFEMEWPPRSGRMQSFPEVDRAGWFGLERGGGEAEPRAGGLSSERLRPARCLASARGRGWPASGAGARARRSARARPASGGSSRP